MSCKYGSFQVILLFMWLVFTCSPHQLYIANFHIFKGSPEQIMNLKAEDKLTDYPKDCSEIPKGSPSGLYIIFPQGLSTGYLVVYCDMYSDGGGWTVIQRSHHRAENIWDQTWQSYKTGFGNLEGEFWLGNEYIHQITNQKPYKVCFVISDANSFLKFASYDLFSVDSESQGYALRLGKYSGNAGDALIMHSTAGIHDNMKFTTKDRDQDFSSGNCASVHGGGWWYNNCCYVRLNSHNNILWSTFCSDCKSSEVLIKPFNAQ
ncbi:fibrinogen-like protein 1-like protein [Protopterus annectens]|uniref:fibrinogen-like protein 1-like protein n=1 Tax=Protopterus annectens TaxID=7888 RepID=UPI001CFC0494|nr:fibrinogen-like protein 1-like protein [Protopterus annectens]